jgi:hypothetical protein
MTQALPQIPCYALAVASYSPLPEKIQRHPPLPTALDQLQAVDVAFDWPV